ncbi:GMC oxidoreductase [Patellaria atrata CBS 101060]|uniref:GMC oxidoreductase n=1 Tax=Patellaria atrata CBS 101060 TaxID=1346257 RepID=A0A9P4S769_9PEZI|nr:GMC oxidoreductase [Patellaria atrata CBS 101060]
MCEPGIRRAAQVKEEYDYVVIGGGTAGLTVADRLTEDPSTTVLVIEYGYFDDSPDVLLVRGGANSIRGPTARMRQWNITSVPQVNLRNRTTSVTVGAVVGGSSALNGMIFDRGSAEDYDQWRVLNSPDSTWDWKGLLPYFKKSVTFVPPEPEIATEFNMTWDIEAAYGGTTPVYVSHPTFLWPGIKIMRDAWAEIPGVTFPKEGAAGEVGVMWFPSSVDPVTVTRSYARYGHYENLRRENYDLLSAHKAVRVNFEGSVAGSVDIAERDADGIVKSTVKARKEIIIAAGAIHTPQVLQLSGVGPKSLLESADIPVLVDLPGVGQNFQDHGGMGYTWRFDDNVSPNPTDLTVNATFIAEAEAAWEKDKTGPYSLGVTVCGAFLGLPVMSPDRYESIAAELEAQDAAAYLPEGTHPTVVAGYKAQLNALAGQMRSNVSAVFEMLCNGSPNGSLVNLKPFSRGTVNIDPSDPYGKPIVDYRALTNPLDVVIVAEMLKLTRRYFNTEMIKQLGPVEVAPGTRVQTDEEFEEAVIASYSPTLYHPVGTAAMLPRELGGVVGEDLLVYGVQKLSVVDGSMMPLIPGTHTCTTVYAVAEKAADIIKARHPHEV